MCRKSLPQVSRSHFLPDPSPPPTSTPPPVAPPSPARPPIAMPPPAYVLYVGREFVCRSFQTAHRHGRCNVRNEHRAKKGGQSDESYSDVFHGQTPPFWSPMLV